MILAHVVIHADDRALELGPKGVKSLCVNRGTEPVLHVIDRCIGRRE
jgi:hypothetical protein